MDSGVDFAADMTGVRLQTPKDNVYKIDFENAEGLMHFEAPDLMVNYLSIQIKKTQGCKEMKAFYPEPYLKALGIDPSKLQKRESSDHVYFYADLKRDIRIQIGCPYDGGRYMVVLTGKTHDR